MTVKNFNLNFKSVVLNQGDYAPQGIFNNVWRYFWLSQLGVGQGCVCATGIW